MCQRNNLAQNTFKTQLHHMSYIDYDEDPFLWTIELCPRCHTRVDEHRKARISQHFDRKHKQEVQEYEKERERFWEKVYNK